MCVCGGRSVQITAVRNLQDDRFACKYYLLQVQFLIIIESCPETDLTLVFWTGTDLTSAVLSCIQYVAKLFHPRSLRLPFG